MYLFPHRLNIFLERDKTAKHKNIIRLPSLDETKEIKNYYTFRGVRRVKILYWWRGRG
jgi:hypothetical protein